MVYECVFNASKLLECINIRNIVIILLRQRFIITALELGDNAGVNMRILNALHEDLPTVAI